MPTRLNSLRNAVLLFVLLPLLLVVGGTVTLGLQEFQTQMENRMQADIELVARSIRLPVATAMIDQDVTTVQQSLDSLFQIDQVFGVYVYDAQGDMVATSGPPSPTIRHPGEAQAISETGSLGAFDEHQGREVFSFFLPLSDSAGRIVGLLQVTRDVSPFRAYVSQLRWQGGMVMLAVSVLFLLVVLIGHHRAVGRHVARLIGAMRDIGDGQRGLRAPEKGPWELRRLAITMNGMLERREASEAALQAQREEQARLEEKLRHSEKLAAIGQLAAGVAHELGTPLGIIAGRAQRAARRLPADDPAHKEMKELQAELERVETIVRQLLDFARRNPLQQRPLELQGLVREIVARVQERGKGREQVRFDLDGGALTVAADRLRLGQALENLIDNAAQAAAECVRVSWRCQGDTLECVIADDAPRAGRGISDEQADRLFEPFFTTKPTGEGTGLGLAVAQVALEDHGGQVRLDRNDPQLTRFVVTLPLASGACRDRQSEPSGAESVQDGHATGGGAE
ncbi:MULTISPECIES: ATP-binding protein [unclassified Thioalkalivibrio]|uniref:sensor histidine kinase n=1 Tax=unclassified Thioalkalivibrio TaxID=2621013 RepID=UPI0003812E94|nr:MULTISPECIES: ATP-binding protein [unclassified Thioalkalivibrio]